ncbi:hypothetical protein CYY_000285 [Polysphondylium violaceum]|uniref:SET domain-containing protein n=1 Tax=Polysphondylium violaceum TaxID=133409 RepID=A0A8J4V5U4_9MYCE|nr:hypothetical protein CYY_000285 [Polysphondylium violaceum]
MNDQVFWKKKIIEDFGESILNQPQQPQQQDGDSDIVYFKLYVDHIKSNEENRKGFSERYKEVCKLVFEESHTSLTEMILEADLGSIKYQLSNELRRNKDFFKDLGKPPRITDLPNLNRMALFFSVGTDDVEIVRYILDNGGKSLLNFFDPVTKASVFHLAMALGNKDIISLLIESNVNVSHVDAFRATGFDYARLMNTIPHTTPPNPLTIKVYNHLNNNLLEEWDLNTVEKELNIVYCPRVIGTVDYLIDLFFSSLSINPDMKFRNKYLKKINTSGGEENVIMGYINEQVGWGLFANKHFSKGEYIVRYGGMITMNTEMNTTDYNMMISNEDFGLDASKYRSLGGMINHSSKNKNAESECIFEYGCEQALITATKDIPKGTQILIDYSKSYWQEDQVKSNTNEMADLGGTKEYPSIITNL